jgi:hypothetical protein
VGVTLGVAVGPGVGVRVGVGVLVGVAVGPPPPPDGAGMAAVSRRMSSKVALTALELVAPMRTSLAWPLMLSLVLLANGLPNTVSPVARYASSTPVPLPLDWRTPMR